MGRPSGRKARDGRAGAEAGEHEYDERQQGRKYQQSRISQSKSGQPQSASWEPESGSESGQPQPESESESEDDDGGKWR